jgi:hypothetical protein
LTKSIDEREEMGLFSRKKKASAAPPQSSMAGQQGARGGYVGSEPVSDPNLPGIAGWCGSAKTGSPRGFNYVRPDGKPDRKRGYWSDPDEAPPF